MTEIKEIWEKLDRKLSKTAVKSFDKIPYTSVNGEHDNMAEKDITWWTNGFWPGLCLLMYNGTGKELYLKTARNAQNILDNAFKNRDGLHHDVGFMWHLSSGADYRLTGDNTARTRALFAADMLAARFMPKGGFIRAWNDENGIDRTGWTIIDCMMNIPLLYWASDELNVSNYKDIAMTHADMTLRDHIRPDGSVNHICVHDTNTGELLKTLGGQGYGEGSSWSRGQAWAIYGFAQSYLHTKEIRYLDAAKKTANYFIAALGEDYIPVSDFRAPKTPVIYDTTAGVIASCGMITIARELDENEGRMYLDKAIKIIKETDRRFCDWSDNEDTIVQMGSESYQLEKGQLPIIYGDYYFAEAVSLLMGFKRTN
ncbi:MAG: glycoside hydrolase family 88 protein [Clostridia bacterium]